jgi:hypothetical protein
MKSLSLILVASAALRVCGETPRQPSISSAPRSEQVVPSAGEHGGSVAATGAISTEITAEPDGRLVAYVRDPQGQPVQAHAMSVSIRRPDEDPVPVAMTYDAPNHRYVGRVAGVPAGSYPIEVSVQPTASAPAVEVVAPPVQISAVASVPTARHGGRVQLVGDYAVETVAARGGDVAMYFYDREGQPVPPAEVRVPTVNVQVEGRVVPVQPRLEGEVWVARVGVPLTQEVVVAVPDVEIRGHRHVGVVVPAVAVVPVLPSAVVVARGPAVRGAVVAPGAVVATPGIAVQAEIVAPSVVIAPAVPGVVVVHDGHPRGRHRGWHRGRGHRGWGWFR